MMCNDIFCPYNKISCNCNKGEGLVSFRYIEFSEGKFYEDVPDEGIRWGFVLSGTLSLLHQQDSIEVKEGEMFLVYTEGFRFQAVSDVEFIFFISDRPTEFCVRMLAELPAPFVVEEVICRKLEIRDVMIGFLKLLSVYLKSGVTCGSLFQEKQEELFMILKHCYSSEELINFLYPLTLNKNKDLKKFILENCHKAKNVQELAAVCGYSVGGFKRIFKEIFKEPVYRWMLQQKADQLKIRLREKDVNLKSIIDEFGFSSPAHFTKFCKQWLGMVPTEFIKAHSKKIEF